MTKFSIAIHAKQNQIVINDVFRLSYESLINIVEAYTSESIEIELRDSNKSDECKRIVSWNSKTQTLLFTIDEQPTLKIYRDTFAMMIEDVFSNVEDEDYEYFIVTVEATLKPFNINRITNPYSRDNLNITYTIEKSNYLNFYAYKSRERIEQMINKLPNKYRSSAFQR